MNKMSIDECSLPHVCVTLVQIIPMGSSLHLLTQA